MLLVVDTVAGLVCVVMLMFCAGLPLLSVMVQVTVDVTSCPPGFAVTVSMPMFPRAIVKLVGWITIEVTLFNVTVTVLVPVWAEADAVMVAVPELAPVTRPPDVIGATFVSSLDQKTPLVRVLVLPSS